MHVDESALPNIRDSLFTLHSFLKPIQCYTWAVDYRCLLKIGMRTKSQVQGRYQFVLPQLRIRLSSHVQACSRSILLQPRISSLLQIQVRSSQPHNDQRIKVPLSRSGPRADNQLPLCRNNMTQIICI